MIGIRPACPPALRLQLESDVGIATHIARDLRLPAVAGGGVLSALTADSGQIDPQVSVATLARPGVRIEAASPPRPPRCHRGHPAAVRGSGSGRTPAHGVVQQHVRAGAGVRTRNLPPPAPPVASARPARCRGHAPQHWPRAAGTATVARATPGPTRTPVATARATTAPLPSACATLVAGGTAVPPYRPPSRAARATHGDGPAVRAWLPATVCSSVALATACPHAPRPRRRRCHAASARRLSWVRPTAGKQ